jgi:hypothetical protein
MTLATVAHDAAASAFNGLFYATAAPTAPESSRDRGVTKAPLMGMRSAAE